ncbi:uncharacterized protein [Apostichopus japonicus]|uniref:uncharacterized protein n=1 Tax=Stichopus japonicus TaxID=307972 RepID=UPI003AB31757
METPLKIEFIFILLAAFMVRDYNALRVIGHTEESFETDLSYITRYVVAPNTDVRFQYSVKIPAGHCCSDLVGFFGVDEQWPLIRAHGHEMTCYEKLDTVLGITATVFPLIEGHSYHKCLPETEITGKEVTHCFGDRIFRHSEAQWYYFTFMNCHARSHSGINATFDLHLTNIRNRGAVTEFSADEDTNLYVTFICDIIMVGCIVTGFVFGVVLWSRKMLHTTYKMWILSLCLHFIGCVIMTTAWYKFSLDGFERKKQVSFGHYFTSAGSIVFAIMLIVISKGYTITRLTIRTVGKVKIIAFASWFAFCYTILYIILGQSDPRDVKNIYDTPAALGIVGMRIGATIWCIYGAVFTLKDFPKKGAFYLIFTILSSSWFLAEPVMILFSNFWLPLYCRAKWVHAMYLLTLVVGHVVFVILTRPSATNKYFPFHLSTNKVGIMENEETGLYEHEPTEETFSNFIATSLRPEEDRSSIYLEKETNRATAASNSSQKQPSKGRFDIFMAGSERAKVERKTNACSPVPSISSVISIIDCPLPPPSYLPVTYIKDDDDSQVPILNLGIMDQQIQSYENDSESINTTLDKDQDWANLVMENLDAPEDNSYETASTKQLEQPAKPQQNLRLTKQKESDIVVEDSSGSDTVSVDMTYFEQQYDDSSKAKYTVTVPMVKTPALTGQNGMYALADSDESDDNSGEDCDQASPIRQFQSTFKNIFFELPKQAVKSRKSCPPSKKQEQLPTVTKVVKDEVTAAPKYDLVPKPAKGRVIYVKPADTPVLQLRAPRKDSLTDKLTSAPTVQSVLNAGRVDSQATSDSAIHQTTIRATDDDLVMDAVNNSAPDNTSVPISEDNVTAPSIDQSRRSRERARKSANGGTEADRRHGSSADRRKSKEHVSKRAVEEAKKVKDSEEICLPSTDRTFAETVNAEEVMEVEDLEETCLPITSAVAHQRSRGWVKSKLQNDDSFQLDNKTIDDAESVGPYEMERGRQRERQERRRTKHRETSASDRRRPSVTRVDMTDSGVQNKQDQVADEEKTTTERKTKKHQKSSSYYEVEDEVNQQPLRRSRHRDRYAIAEEGEQKRHSERRSKHSKTSMTSVMVENEHDQQSGVIQKQGKHCGPTASEVYPESAACAQPLVTRQKSRKIPSSELSIEDVIEQEPVRRSKHRKHSVTSALVENKRQQQQTNSQKQGKHCGPTASEVYPETAACAQPSVRRKKTHKNPSSELTIEDVIEQAPAMDEAKAKRDRKRKILKMRAALEMEEKEYRKKLNDSNNSESSHESTVEEEVKKNRRRHAIHKARRTLGRNDTFEQE